MTIVATEDSRNADWKNGSKGASLLKKMGWTEGQGLGRDKQGTAHALRAVKRTDETLGIGASSADTHGESGWNDTSDNFASVLSKLQQHHGESSSSTSSDDNDNKKRKKKRKKKRELTLARNKVAAGHSKKMREAKCLKNKSEADMAAIFGTPQVVAKSTSSESDKKKKSKKRSSRDDSDDGERIKKKKSKKSSSS